jgi:hypothetical protein
MTTSRGRSRVAIVLFLAAPAAAAAAPPGDRAQRCVNDSYRGQEQRDRGAFVEARASFRACAVDECPAIVRKDCADWLAAVDVNVPTVVVGAKDAQGGDLFGVRIAVDGKAYAEEAASGRAIALDPGPHVFRFEHPPDAPIELRAVLHTGEHNRPIFATFAPPPPPAVAPAAPARVDSPATPPPKHVSGWAYAIGGVSLAGLGVFAYLGATGLSEKNQLRATCGDTCSDAQVAPLKARYIGADASLGVGVVAGAIATWLFFHPSAERSTATGLAPTVYLTAKGTSVGIEGRF